MADEISYHNMKCVRAGHQQTEPHTCPYQTEINEDYTTLCACCPDCKVKCMDEV